MQHLAVELHAAEEYGRDELMRSESSFDEIRLELLTRAVAGWGIEDAVVPWSFPLELADRLRDRGVRLRTDRDLFDDRRRVKNEAELAGIRRAQAGADAGMEAVRASLRAGLPTCEQVRAAIEAAVAEHDCTIEIAIVSHGAQTAIGHELGSGQIERGEPVVVDLAPRDRETGCFADMTRTFVVGDIPAELAEWHRLTREVLEEVVAGMRPGASAHGLHRRAAELYKEHGHPTFLDKQDGVPLEEGFYHALGHGVGLEVHERPILGDVERDSLVAGDVIAIEPGTYRQGFGGVRLEDLILVTDDGAERLTQHPYDLEP
jgi:Xaa-Pro aminopeptidase